MAEFRREDHAWTFEGKIREELEECARRYGIKYDEAARAFVEVVFDWMAR